MRRFIKTNCLWQGPCSKLYNGGIGVLLNLLLIFMCMPNLKAQCDVVPPGVSCGAFTVGDCSQSYNQTCVVDGPLAKISTGTNYTCNNVCFVLTNNPTGSTLTLASSTQLILNNSGIANKTTVPDANGFFLQNTSGLQLHNVKSEGAIYLIQTQKDPFGQSPTANVCATNSSDLSNAEMDLSGNSSLVTDNTVNKLWQILVADSVDLVLHNAQVLGDLLMTSDGANPVNPISVSNINNGNGCMIDSQGCTTPAVTFSCGPSGFPSCVTPYPMTVTSTQIRALRFRIKNGATANLTNLDTTIIDFFLNGTCAGKTLDNLPSTRGPGGACAPPLDLSAKKSGLVQLNCGVNNIYTVDLTNVAVQGYGFASRTGDLITITDPTTDTVETNTFGNSGVTIDSAFDPMNRATRAQAAELSSVDQSSATVNNADLSCANLGFFLAGFTNMTQTPQITVKNCKFPLPSPNSATAEAVAGTIWFIDGTAIDGSQDCGQPTNNRCSGTGLVCRWNRALNQVVTLTPQCGTCPLQPPR